MIRNFSAYRQVMHDLKLPRSELNHLIRERLRTVLTSAYQDVPYYRNMMRKIGYYPLRDYRGPEDLSLFPITTKQILKEEGTAAFTKPGIDLSKCYSETTSGSTGIPLTIYQAPYERAVMIAKWLRVLFVNGYSLRQKVLEFSRVKENLVEGRSILQYLGLLRRLHIDGRLSIETLADSLLEYKPDVFYCLGHNLELLVYELKRRGIKPNGLKLVIGYGEIIYERTRQLCRKYLGPELIENYGSVEMGSMAYETPNRDGLHLCEDLTYFEFINDDGSPVEPGEPGRVVATDLMGKLMPLIRYDQGDRAVFQYVECGDGDISRRITEIIGREDDLVVMPDGSKRRHNMFNSVLKNYKNIFQFRIIQRRINFFEIFIAAAETYVASIHDEALQKLQRKFSPGVDFEIHHVDQIKSDPSGKLRQFISEVR